MSNDKFIMLTNMAGIPTVAYEKATGNVMPPHTLLSDPDANAIETKPEEKPGFIKSILKDKAKLRKFGVFTGIALLGIGIGVYMYNKKKRNG